ncbi:hypothetical protein PR048_015275 [Dryococelus australis]|uniref:Uncharacterized protein n=1 Tax=Dryococelus australis TaxID=614101 RepID=A0ABQ9HGR8_9NEOP|nr:hypothetical protein PR048_015275 [Dryococelus australis]
MQSENSCISPNDLRTAVCVDTPKKQNLCRCFPLPVLTITAQSLVRLRPCNTSAAPPPLTFHQTSSYARHQTVNSYAAPDLHSSIVCQTPKKQHLFSPNASCAILASTTNDQSHHTSRVGGETRGNINSQSQHSSVEGRGWRRNCWARVLLEIAWKSMSLEIKVTYIHHVQRLRSRWPKSKMDATTSSLVENLCSRTYYSIIPILQLRASLAKLGTPSSLRLTACDWLKRDEPLKSSIPPVAPLIWTALNIAVLRPNEGATRYGAAPECKGGGNGRSLRKSAYQRHLPAGFPLRNPGVDPPGIEPGSPRWEASSLTTTPPRPLVPLVNVHTADGKSCQSAASHRDKKLVPWTQRHRAQPAYGDGSTEVAEMKKMRESSPEHADYLFIMPDQEKSRERKKKVTFPGKFSCSRETSKMPRRIRHPGISQLSSRQCAVYMWPGAPNRLACHQALLGSIPRRLIPGCTNIFPYPRSNDPSSEQGSSLILVPNSELEWCNSFLCRSKIRSWIEFRTTMVQPGIRHAGNEANMAPGRKRYSSNPPPPPQDQRCFPSHAIYHRRIRFVSPYIMSFTSGLERALQNSPYDEDTLVNLVCHDESSLARFNANMLGCWYTLFCAISSGKFPTMWTFLAI